MRAFFPLYVSIILELSEHLEHLERNHHVIANLEQIKSHLVITFITHLVISCILQNRASCEFSHRY